MLRFAKAPLRARSVLGRQASNRPPTKAPSSAGNGSASNQIPTRNAGPTAAPGDGSFRTKVTAFIIFQGILLGIFGVAHRMEDDAVFAAKIEQYYGVAGVKPTLETFRGIVRTIQPPMKKVDRPSGLDFSPKSATPTSVQQQAPAAKSTEKEKDQKSSKKSEEKEEGGNTEVAAMTATAAVANTAIIAPEDAPAAATAAAVVAAPSEPAPSPSTDKQQQQQLEQEQQKGGERDGDATLSALEQKMAAMEAENAVIRARMQTAEDDREAEAQRQREKAVVLPAVDAEIRAANVEVATSEAVLEEMSRHANQTRKDLQHSLLQDLHELSEKELRQRIQQLAAEFFERTKWEGLRLHDSLKQLEEEITSKYSALLQDQRAQLQNELERALIQREKDVSSKYAAEVAVMEKKQEESVLAAVKAQAAGFHRSKEMALEEETARLQQVFADEYNLQVALMKNDHVKQLLSLSSHVEALKAELSAYRNVASNMKAMKEQIRALNQEAAAVLTLEAALSTSTALGTVVNALKRSCAGNDVILGALNSIPAHGLKDGIATVPEIRERFKTVRKEVRRASLIPENVPTFLGEVVGTVLSKVSWNASEQSKVDTAAGEKDIEDHLATVAYLVDQGRLQDAIQQAEFIGGYPRMLMGGWENDVRARLVADKVVAVLKADVALKKAQFAAQQQQQQ